MIGYLGDVAFEVSSQKVRTFDEFKRSSSARIASHDLIGRKPLAEFTGPGAVSLSFKVVLSAFHGVDPVGEVETLRAMMDMGQAVPLVLDGKPQGDGKWLVESLEEGWRHIEANGKPALIECNLKLREYVESLV